VAKTGDASALFAYKDHAWRNLFWVALPPGILFLLGSLMVSESPRWLFKRGKKEQHTRSCCAHAQSNKPNSNYRDGRVGAQCLDDQLDRREDSRVALAPQVCVPFVLACLVLFCTQTTGVNSIIGYNTSILLQGGLSDLHAHWGYVVFTSMNFLLTIVRMHWLMQGRNPLILGTSGIILSLVGVGILFLRTEKVSLDARAQVQGMVIRTRR